MIELKNVSKIYNERERNEVRALQNISLKIKKGEFIAIMGPSGSGKSTLMHIIGCLDHPTKGQYFLDNENVKKLSGKKLAQIRNQKVGFVFQTFNLLPRTTALENVLIPLYYSRKKINQIQKAKKIIKKLGLEDRASHFTNELSGGLIGLAFTYGATQIIRLKTPLTPEITWQALAIAIGVAVGVGIIFGIAPAIRAARKDPIEALRYE